MPFSQETIDRAMKIAGDRCECDRIACDHTGRCTNEIDLQAHHIRPARAGGPDSLENCEVLCAHCHEELHKRDQYRYMGKS